MEPREEIYTALVLGTRDYVAKNNFDTVVLGLSGGIDSSLTACIAVDALGAAHVLGVVHDCLYHHVNELLILIGVCHIGSIQS